MWFLISLAHAQPDFVALAEDQFRVRHLGRTAADVQLDSETVQWAGGVRVRVRPSLQGLRVYGASQVAAFASDGRPQRYVGPALTLGTVPAGLVGREQAMSTVVGLPLGQVPLWAPRAEDALLWRDGTLHRVWAVDVGYQQPLRTFRVFVDASTGQVLELQPTSHQAMGRVWPTSPLDEGTVDVELAALDGSGVLSGEYVDAYSCTDWTIPDALFAPSTCDALERRALPVNGDFLYDPSPGMPEDPFTEVNLYHHVTEVAAWYHERFGLRRQRPFTTIANFEMANAFYGDFDGDQVADLAFGFSEGTQFGYDADVVYHEYGHWLVARLAEIPSLRADEIGLDWVGGSINEGAADVFSMLLNPDPDVGEYSGQGFRDGPIRALEANRRCPDDLEGEVHKDGEIIGALGWNLIQRLGTERTSQLMVGAVSLWGWDVDWSTVAAAFEASADDLHAEGVLDEAEVRFVREQVLATGMSGCPRIIPLDSGQVQHTYVLSGGLEGGLYRMPGQNQFSIDVPPDAERLVIEVGDFSGGDGLVWSLLMRTGEPVLTEPSNLATLGLGFSSPILWDWVADGDEAFEGVVLDANSNPPLQPGQTVYIAVAGRSDGGIELFDFTRGRLGLRAWTESPESAAGACSTGAPGAPWNIMRWMVRR